MAQLQKGKDPPPPKAGPGNGLKKPGTAAAKPAADTAAKDAPKPTDAKKPETKDAPKPAEPKKPEAPKPGDAGKPQAAKKDEPKPAEAKKPEPAKPKDEPKKPEAKEPAKPADEAKKPEPAKPKEEAPKPGDKPKEEAKPPEPGKPKEEPKKPEAKPATEPPKPAEQQKAPEPAKVPEAKPADKPAAAPAEKPKEPAKPAAPEKPKEEPPKPAEAKPPADKPKVDEKKPAEPPKQAASEPAKPAATEPAKPAADKKEPVPVKVAPPPKTDMFGSIFYFSGIGSLLGSALAEGVYVPESGQRTALDADAMESANTKRRAINKTDQVVTTARNQAQALSTDFRNLQSLLESVPTFGEPLQAQPLDRRAIDQPIHGHVYFRQSDQIALQAPPTRHSRTHVVALPDGSQETHISAT